MSTRVGSFTLRVPRHRNGQFSTELFSRYQRSEQALVLAMMEMVVNGVSTRKVELITEELCGKKFSKSTISELCKNLDPIVEAFRTRPLQSHYPFLMVDAIYVKVRENGRVQSRGMLIAIAVNEDGYREIIGFQLANSEYHTPKALQTEIKEELRRLYEAVALESARKIRDHIIQTYKVKAPKATAFLDEAFDDITAV